MDLLLTLSLEDLPAELKPTCEQILKRAREVRKREPVVAYWCCFSAASASLNIKRSPEGTAFLMQLLTVLEEMKRYLLSLPPTHSPPIDPATITDEAAGSALVEQFANRVFMAADDEDRAGKAGRSTIRNFVIAAQYIEVLRCFEPPNGMREEMEQKLQYARWKASDIAKALREGRRPHPGPRGFPSRSSLGGNRQADDTGWGSGSGSAKVDDPLEDELKALQLEGHELDVSSQPEGDVKGSTSSSTLPATQGDAMSPSAAAKSPPTIPTLPMPPSRPFSDVSSSDTAAWSTVATPGIPDDATTTDPTAAKPPPPIDADAAATGSTTSTSSAARRRLSSSAAEKKAVRFAGPDGVPLSPDATVVSLPTGEDEPLIAPPPTVVDEGEGEGDGDGGQSSQLQPPRPVVPPPAKPTALKSLDPHRTSTRSNISTSPYDLPPTLPPPSAPPFQPPPPTPTSGISPPGPSYSALPTQPPAPASRPSPAAPPAPPPTSLDPKSIEQVQKHAKWAISALDYEDLDTARIELNKALAILGV